MSRSVKVDIHFEEKTTNDMIKNHVTSTMTNESIIVFQEALLSEKSLEQALFDATLNEIVIDTLENALK